MIAFASAAQIASSFVDRVNQVILFPLISFLLALALLVFLWGCFEYVWGANNETARARGKNNIMYGIIGMLVMISAYAILFIAANTFGVADPLL